MTRTQAVITGDVNASSTWPPGEARELTRLLEQCFRATAQQLPQARLAGFTPFRGDAFQFLVGNAVLAPRTALFFRALLIQLGDQAVKKKVQAGLAIGFGTVSFSPDTYSSAGVGEAYTRSGKRLDRLRRRVPGMGVAGLGDLDSYLDSILGLTDALIHKWTALQAKAVSNALLGSSQGEIAAAWNPPISQQAVNKHLRAAGWPGIAPALHWTETALADFLAPHNKQAPPGP